MIPVSPAELASVRVDTERESITQQNQTDSPLLRLPAEIRNQIYGHVFHDAHVKVRKVGNHSRSSHRYQSACGILFACQQIRHEALPSFYAAAMFKFEASVSPVRMDDVYGSNEFWQLNVDTRKGVQNISIPQAALESIYISTFYVPEGRDAKQIRCLRGVFPALNHIHTTWELDEDLTDDTTMLRDMVRDVFDKDDIELHAPPPPEDYYFSPSRGWDNNGWGWDDGEIFD